MAATRQSRAVAHRERERQIVDATRALFDESGRQDARIDRIARRVGINKALVYRHFVSKEELFALTTTRYLAEINALLEAVDDEELSPSERLSRGFEAFADYGIEHPAFLDCALSLVREPAELQEQVSDVVLLRLSQATAAWIGWLADVLRRPRRPRARNCAPTSSTSRRSGSCISPAPVPACARSRPASPSPSRSAPDEVRAACVQLALAAAGTD